MIRTLSIVVTVILTSFYLFPFEFKFLPGMNTKMIMAGIGLIVLLYEITRQRKYSFHRWLTILSVWGGVVSIFGLIAIVYNDTPDMTYATYIISMWVWLSGAYFLNYIFRRVHGAVSIVTVINYLVAVCAGQCLIALLIDVNPTVKNFVDGFVAGSGYMGVMEDRLYGIGASLDVAGIRFSAILIMIGSMIAVLSSDSNDNRLKICVYTAAFFFIALIGNMIARTTTVGVIIAIVTLQLVHYSHNKDIGLRQSNIAVFYAVLVIALCIVVYYYNVNTRFHDNIRFGFEGFFSLVEQGEWHVHSNDILKNMIVWPEHLKTWFIGDGYIENPYYTDPFYLGPKIGGFYMGTDIGYLRFIYYFGIFGTLAFIAFMWKAAMFCIEKFTAWKIMFWMLLFLNYVVWCKVSTDIFSIFAIFLTLDALSSSEEAEITESIA